MPGRKGLHTPKNSNGLILFEGPSRIVPSRSIVVIVTGLTENSANPKTGPMIQSWILDASEEPHHANRSNADRSVCGACKFRVDPITGKRTCYVVLHHAPLNVFRAYARGSYARVDWSTWPDLVAGRWGRLGSFGDPAAVEPLAIPAIHTNLRALGFVTFSAGVLSLQIASRMLERLGLLGSGVFGCWVRIPNLANLGKCTVRPRRKKAIRKRARSVAYAEA